MLRADVETYTGSVSVENDFTDHLGFKCSPSPVPLLLQTVSVSVACMNSRGCCFSSWLDFFFFFVSAAIAGKFSVLIPDTSLIQ